MNRRLSILFLALTAARWAAVAQEPLAGPDTTAVSGPTGPYPAPVGDTSLGKDGKAGPDTVYVEKVYYLERPPRDAAPPGNGGLTGEPWSLFCLQGKPMEEQSHCLEFPPIRLMGGVDNGEGIGWAAELGYHFNHMGYLSFPLFALAQGRFGSNHTWTNVRPRVYRRYSDQRFLVGGAGGLQKTWRGSYIAYGAAGGGYSFGNYRGTSLSSPAHWVPWAEAGWGIRWRRLALITGVQYADMVRDRPLRVSLKLGMLP